MQHENQRGGVRSRGVNEEILFRLYVSASRLLFLKQKCPMAREIYNPFIKYLMAFGGKQSVFVTRQMSIELNIEGEFHFTGKWRDCS